MKKLLALLVALCMVLSLCPALAEETQELKDARSYINLMYKNKPASTPKDYELVGSVPGETETFTVEWTTDSDTIAVIREESGLVKIDVNEDNPKEVAYKLTATILDAAGNSIQISFDRVVPAAINLDVMTEEEIVAVAYTLDDGAALPTATALCGTVVAIPSAWSDEYKNITVNIQVGDLADQIIQCYRLTGEGAADIKEGDHIAVFGVIKNYKGTIEFDKGCVLIPDEYCQSARVAGFAYGLEEGAAMSRTSTMTGVISAIPSAYSEEYKNITVNIDVPGLEGYTVQCYRLVGEGAADLKEGDLITVTGTIKNYKGTIEFDKGCEIVANPESAGEADIEAELEALLAGLFSGEEAAEGEEGAGLGALFGQLLGSEEAAEGEEGAGLGALFGQLLGGEEAAEGEGLGDILNQFVNSDEAATKLGDFLGQVFSGEEGSAENAVLGLLGELGVDTTGYEEKISSVVGEAKSALSELGSSVSGLWGEIKEGLGAAASKIGSGIESFLVELNDGEELTKSVTASDIEEIITTIENNLKEALEKDPEGEEAKVLSELLEAAKTLVPDDAEALEAFFVKVIEVLTNAIKES